MAKKYPAVGTFKTEKELKKHYKGLSDAELAEWVKQEKLEYKPSEHAAINRMRMAMAVLYKHFPKQSKPKTESKYKEYTLEQLVELAATNEVPVEVCDDQRILRMRIIMALRASKVIG